MLFFRCRGGNHEKFDYQSLVLELFRLKLVGQYLNRSTDDPRAEPCWVYIFSLYHFLFVGHKVLVQVHATT